jgi:ribosomal protein S18 acetylase RimI-like enzyme
MADPRAPLAFELGPALRRDVAAVALLWEESTRYHAALDPRFIPAPDATQRYAEYLESLLGRRDHRLRLARGAEGLLGFCLTQAQPENHIFPQGRVGFLSDLAVTEAAQRCGVGRALAEDALVWLKECGVRTVQLTVAQRNPKGQRFWREVLGFRPYMDRLWKDI